MFCHGLGYRYDDMDPQEIRAPVTSPPPPDSDFSALGLPVPLVHVGYPKALSSWLQKFLFKPDYGFVKVLDAVQLQLSLIDPTPFRYTNEAAVRYARESLAKAGDRASGCIPVATAEALIGNTYCGGYNARQNADRLRQLFPQARILIIVREQQRFIRSLYKTLVTWGMPHTPTRLLNPTDVSMAPQFNLDFLRFDLAVGYYQSLFGADNVLVLPYERFAEDPQGFIEAILQHAGARSPTPLDRLPLQKRINPNQTLLNLYLQRLHNLLFLSSPFNYAGLFRSTESSIHRRVARSRRNPFPAWLDPLFEDGFRDTVARHCHGQFGESNRRLCELTGLDLARYGYEITPP